MATQADPQALNIEEQLMRIRKMGAEFDKALIDIQKTRVDMDKTLIDIQKTRVDIDKVVLDKRIISFATIFQGLIAIAALIGAGAALAKLFFP